MEAAQEAMEEAREIILEIEIDEDAIKHDVQKTVRLALMVAEEGLREMEIEFKDFDSKEFKHEMEEMQRGMEKAVKDAHITKEEMNRIMAQVEKSREEALQKVHKALKEVRESLRELREENKRRKEG